ncbi:hypothetical protein [Phaeobacter gallaeciensis]|uniref:hypothetical protein n=1 Tax=Phaeobacter gallaeciensis TaxID=60890 RepID=UPI0003D6B158|nr:hypothetical protein [Phaeobacter gallaeciensis]AHD12140.1 hypothetical protein Gal_04436 [Phaeobacter gallaeciensis DSM 26640]ATE95324.1 hypothetical protein PhaeoP11_04340 [Phaeobacter gallaeciensis]
MHDFPTGLPRPSWRDISLSAPSGSVQETEMEIGPSKRRRRSTGKRSEASIVIAPVSEANLQEFEDFFANDLAQGVHSFRMLHPIYERPAIWRFSLDGAYSVNPIGEDAHEIEVQLVLIS